MTRRSKAVERLDTVVYLIDDREYELSIKDSPDYRFGSNEVLSTSTSDIAFGQSWYDDGYKAFRFLDTTEFDHLVEGLTRCIANIITTELHITPTNFELSKYHQVVTTDEGHFKVVSKTRDLFPDDFSFPITEIIPTFEQILGFRLTSLNPRTNTPLHTIVRINRPHSTDYNPPHKDIYEAFDGGHYIPQFINLWIPICGVTDKSSLPLAPASHLLSEDTILRTFDGGVVEGHKYRVRAIREWNGSNRLERAQVEHGEVLFFTSHLIHGLAINEEDDSTRVALEFRLFKRD